MSLSPLWEGKAAKSATRSACDADGTTCRAQERGDVSVATKGAEKQREWIRVEIQALRSWHAIAPVIHGVTGARASCWGGRSCSAAATTTAGETAAHATEEVPEALNTVTAVGTHGCNPITCTGFVVAVAIGTIHRRAIKRTRWTICGSRTAGSADYTRVSTDAGVGIRIAIRSTNGIAIALVFLSTLYASRLARDLGASWVGSLANTTSIAGALVRRNITSAAGTVGAIQALDTLSLPQERRGILTRPHALARVGGEVTRTCSRWTIRIFQALYALSIETLWRIT